MTPTTVELHLNTTALLKDVEALLKERSAPDDEEFQIPAKLIEKHIFYVEKIRLTDDI